MAQAKLRIGIIGTGMIATAGHIPAWKFLKDDVEIVGLADVLGERAECVAQREEIPHAYGDWQKMLRELQPDVVSVCSPNSYHKDQTIGCLQAGSHVLCEKPIATSHADAAAMYQAAERAGKTLLVCQVLRFTQRALAAREIVEAGRLGEIYFAETTAMRRRGIPTWGQFHMKAHSGGGPVFDLGVHAIDLLYWLMGNKRVVAVSSMAVTKLGNRDEKLATSLADSGAFLGVLNARPFNHRDFDVEDMAAGFIRLEGGAAVAFKTSWAANVSKNTGGTMILGTEGGLSMDPLTLVSNLGSYQVNIEPQVPSEEHGPFSGHWGVTAHMVGVIRGQQKLIVRKEEVLNVMRTLDLLYQSAAEGREVLAPKDGNQ
jgi:predicted dehydrogenase